MKTSVIIGGASAASLAVGVAVGYILAEKKLEHKYGERAEWEIAEAKKFYSRLYKKNEFDTPEKAAETLIFREVIKDLHYSDEAESPDEASEEVVEEILEDVNRNIFNTPADVMENAPDESPQNPNLPYIISDEDYFQAEPGYEQATLTYFVGDGILADDTDEPVEDVLKTVGEGNLRFGYMSNDPNVVYIRNRHLRLDFEILKSDGKYAVEVLGLVEQRSPGI